MNNDVTLSQEDFDRLRAAKKLQDADYRERKAQEAEKETVTISFSYHQRLRRAATWAERQ